MSYSVDSMRCRVDNLRYRVDSMRYRVDNLRYRVDNLRYRVDNLRYRVESGNLMREAVETVIEDERLVSGMRLRKSRSLWVRPEHHGAPGEMCENGSIGSDETNSEDHSESEVVSTGCLQITSFRVLQAIKTVVMEV
jgi:hypothetical protein